MKSTVSVLIPCFNSERFISEAVQSALNQTHDSMEVIVVDDGSTDRSVELLRSFGKDIVLETGPNRGACLARNRAFELSRGQFIQFLDADDKLTSTKIETQLPLLTQGQADLVLAKIGLFGDEKGERMEKRVHPDPKSISDPFDYFSRHPIQTASPLHRREFVEKSGGFLPGLKRGQEADFHLRIAALNPRMAMVDEVMVWVRMHDGERITQRPADINQVVEAWCNTKKHLDRHNTWNSQRRTIVAKGLLESSRSCFSTGNQEIAITGLKTAVEVDPKITAEDRPIRRILTSILDIVRAEQVINKLRR